VRIETTRVAAPMRMRHAAAFCASPADLLAQVRPLVGDALHRGEVVALALRPATERALRDSLGDAGGAPGRIVSLPSPAPADAHSGQTLAGRRARELRAVVADGGAAVVVVEHDGDLDGDDGGFWTELDAAVNIALADLPVDLTCFYPEFPLHLGVVEGARDNHPHLLVDGVLRHNPDHRPPREVLAARPAPAPPLLGAPDVQLRFRAWQLHDVRAAVETAAREAGLEADRIGDVVLAVNEVATNAVEHGTIEAGLQVWTGADGIVCEVHDGGRLLDPLPGLRPPHPGEARGRGVWIARQICDVLHVWADARGTHVRVRAAR